MQNNIRESMIYGYMIEPINEDTIPANIISKAEQNLIISTTKKYKKEIQPELTKNKEYKDIDIVHDKEYLEYMPSDNNIIILFFSMQARYMKSAMKFIGELLEKKLNSDSRLSKYSFKFASCKKYEDCITVMIKDKELNNKFKSQTVEFENFKAEIIKLYNMKYPDYKNEALKIQKEIKSNTILSKEQKSYLMLRIKQIIDYKEKQYVYQKKQEEELKFKEANKDKIKALYDEFAKRITKAGYPSSKKTWVKEEDDGEIYIIFYEYDEDYSGDGSDYDNGLTKADKASNSKFINALYKVLDQMKTDLKCDYDIDVYRGHGTIYFSIPK